MFYSLLPKESNVTLVPHITVNDRYSGYRFSGNDCFSGTKNPDDAILFTVSEITVIVEQM